MSRYSRPSRCNSECSPNVHDDCMVNADILGGIEIVGDGVRAALAELFMTGGCVDLDLTIEIEANCGQVDKILLKANGIAVADMT